MENVIAPVTNSEPIVFTSEKSKLFGWVIWGSVALLVVSGLLPLWEYLKTENQIELLLIVIFCWIWCPLLALNWFNTRYLISGKKIHWRSGVLSGAIDINSITNITKNQTSYSGLKPALARKGLILQYADWKEIYISPVKKDEFVDILVEINPQIKVNEVTINFNKY